MDKRRTLSRDEAIGLVRRYKQVIAPRFEVEPRVMMFGSYSKGYANPDSDIDVAVIVPTYGNRKLEISKLLWHDVDQVTPKNIFSEKKVEKLIATLKECGADQKKLQARIELQKEQARCESADSYALFLGLKK